MQSNTELLSKKGNVKYSEITAPVICYYFSAHWCPPCRGFTPVLAELYNKWNANEKQIEIIFVSSDSDEESFNEYYGTMPWLAVPFGSPLIDQLSELSGHEGIPTLAVVGKDGSILTNEARDYVDDQEEAAIETFKILYQ